MKLRYLRRPIWGPLHRTRDVETAEDEPEAPANGGPPPVGRVVPPVVVPRWIQLVVLPLALFGAWRLAVAVGSLLLVLVVAALLALILNPLAKQLQRVMPRPLAIVAVYVVTFIVIGGIGVLLANPISTQINHFANNLPSLTRKANHELDSVQRWLNRNGIKVHIEAQGQTALETLKKKVLKSSDSIISFSRGLLGKFVTLSVDVILSIVLSIYLLVYAPSIGRIARRVMPPGDGTPEDDYPLLVQRAIAGYVRGQILFSLVMGGSAALIMEILGLTSVFPDGSRYAFFFGAFYGLMELIPYIGPFIGPAPAVLVALFTNPISALWVILAFVVLQQLEGHLVAPQVFRISLRINPILVILALLIGYQLYGIAGALVALPLATVTRATVVYLRRHLVLEPWATVRPPPPPG